MFLPATTRGFRSRAMRLCIAAVSAILITAPCAAADQVDDGEAAKSSRGGRPAWGADEPRAVMIRGRHTLSQFRSDFEYRLTSKVDEIARGCRLRPVQKDKLLLAGRGDIKHFLDRIHDQRNRSKAGAVVEDDFDAADDRAANDVTVAGPFEDGSLFAKTIRRELTLEQTSSLAATDEIMKSGGAISRRAIAEKEVKGVYLTDLAVDDNALTRVCKLSDLDFLALERTLITDAGLIHLQQIEDLDGLRLSDTHVGDAGMKHVSRVQGLRRLWLAGTQISDSGLGQLKTLVNLEVLVLDGTQVTDAGIAELQGLTHLRWLYMRGTQITDASLPNLIGLTTLQRLQLSDTRVTDHGLKHIESLTDLEDLWVGGTPVTDAGIAELKRALPRLTVYK